MQSHYINPHAGQLFPLNASALKISLAVTTHTTTLIKLTHLQVLNYAGKKKKKAVLYFTDIRRLANACIQSESQGGQP